MAWDSTHPGGAIGRSRHNRRLWRLTPRTRRWRRVVGSAYASALRPDLDDIRRVCVVTTRRTGSELLVHLLDSHPQIRFESELLEYAPDFPRLFLRGRASAAAREGSTVHGFKLTADNLERPVPIRQPGLFIDDLEHAGVTFVRLRRLDPIRQAISHERARVLGCRHGASPEQRPSVRPADVISTMVWLEENERRLDRFLAGRAAHDLVYEHDLATPEQQARTTTLLFGALGVQPHEATSALRPSSPPAIEDMIANWNEVETALDASRFAVPVRQS